MMVIGMTALWIVEGERQQHHRADREVPHPSLPQENVAAEIGLLDPHQRADVGNSRILRRQRAPWRRKRRRFVAFESCGRCH
jgi:hypothetical protein